MYLYLDTTERDSFVVVVVDDKRVVKKKRVKSIRKHSEKLLKSIQALLSSAQASLNDIQGIIVAKGPGSFTSLRIGIATANALAYALNIPVVGIDRTDGLGKIFATLEKIFNNHKQSAFVVPEYGREPDTT